MVEWTDCYSRLSLLLYLNGRGDGVQGGATRLYASNGTTVDVEPTKGSALVFRHGMGSGSVLHEGTQVIGDVPKFVARINVMYDNTGRR